MLFDEKYFQAVRPYVPEEARRLLDDQVPVIKKEISAEIDQFATKLADDISAEVDNFVKGQATEMQDLISKFTSFHQKFAASNPPEALKEHAAALQKEIDAFEQRNQKAGETFRKLALTAARSAGLPIPG